MRGPLAMAIRNEIEIYNFPATLYHSYANNLFMEAHGQMLRSLTINRKPILPCVPADSL